MTWNAAEFDKWCHEQKDPVKRQRAMADLTSDQRKEHREFVMFTRFAPAANLNVDPRTIENRKPPEPDILCEVSGTKRYYELGELTDETIPKNEAKARRAGQDIHGGYISQDDPLEKMILQKCGKTFSTNGLELDLLLYFAVGHQVPHEGLVKSWIENNRTRIDAALKASPFLTIWFYDDWEKRIISRIP
jgi:hypothetical protein